jgi:hypothetical protein
MNKWYLGHIHKTPVWIFLSDNWEMDYLCDDMDRIPAKVEAACERIRSARMRSLEGCQRVLKDNGWSNG